MIKFPKGIRAVRFPKVIIRDGAGHYLQLPSLTSTQRTALTAVVGMLIYNSTLGYVEIYDGAWKAIGSEYGDATFPTLTNYNAHVADLDAHTRDMWQVYRTGYYFNPVGIGRADGSNAPGANVVASCLFRIARPITVDRIAVAIETAGAGGDNMRLGIYNDASGDNTPSAATLLVDGGEVDVSTTGLKAVTISQALVRGDYWVVAASEGAGAKIASTTHGIGLSGTLGSTGLYPSNSFEQALTYPASLPATLPAGVTDGKTFTNEGLLLRVLSND